MITEKCPHKGCDFSVTAPKLITVRAIIGKHRKKVHGYQSPGQKYYKAHMKKLHLRRAHMVAAGNSPVEEVETSRQVSTEPTVTASFCPNCGCNLRAITAALNLRRRA